MAERQIIFRADASLVERIAAEAEARHLSRNQFTVRLLAEALDALLPPAEVTYTTLGRHEPDPTDEQGAQE